MAKDRADRVALAAAAVYPTALTLCYFVFLTRASPYAQQGVYVLGKVLQFVFPAAWMLLLHGRGFRLGRCGAVGLVYGMGFGVLAAAAGLLVGHAVLLPSGALEPARAVVWTRLARFGIATPAGYLALAGFYSVVHSLLEEYYWRWFVFGQWRRLASSRSAIAGSSLAFMAHHVVLLGTLFGWTSPMAWGLSASVAVGGAVWAWMYVRFGSLVPSWLGHLVVDAAIFWIGYAMIGLAAPAA